MATSSSYWHFVEAVKDELGRIEGMAVDAYQHLENSDEPGAASSELEIIQARLEHVAQQIAAGTPKLEKIAASLDDLPAFEVKK